MQVISISRGSQELGTDFAKDLATKLGYECIGREDLLEEATRQKIPVGKLETAIVKPHVYSERLALEMEHYKALATSILCEKALDHDIIYHGRTGHLLLQGVDNILRIRIVGSMEHRIASVMKRLDLSRKRAKQYIDAVEEDRRKWVRTFYNVDWDVFTLYDLVLNLSQVSSANAAAAVCSMAELPDFRATPASTAALKDLLLAAKAKLALLGNERTRHLSLKVAANKGVLHVTYSFQQANDVEVITEVLRATTDAKEIICTEAETSLLWIQGSFDPDDSSYSEVLNLANNWDAAVEIMKLAPGEEFKRYPVEGEIAREALGNWMQMGIIDEREEMQEPSDVTAIYEKLIHDGRAGGKRVVEGTQKALLNAIDRSREYRVIILDNIFLSKSAETRKHLTQEWSNAMTETLKTPVISLSDIRAHYQFGFAQAIKMGIFGLLAAIILFSVFHFDNQILAFLSREGTTWRVIAAASVLVFIPVFAFIYGSAVGLALRLIKLD